MKKVLLLFFPIALMLWFSCEEAEDCAGVLGGEAEIDECGVCDEDPANDCVEDCKISQKRCQKFIIDQLIPKSERTISTRV